MAVSAHLDVEPLGKGVDHTHPYAVQTARDLVPFAAELAAGVQLGHDYLKSRPVELGHVLDRDAATVVDYPD